MSQPDKHNSRHSVVAEVVSLRPSAQLRDRVIAMGLSVHLPSRMSRSPCAGASRTLSHFGLPRHQSPVALLQATSMTAPGWTVPSLSATPMPLAAPRMVRPAFLLLTGSLHVVLVLSMLLHPCLQHHPPW